MLTISGTHLDTGSEEDVRVTLNDVPCKVWVSPRDESLSASVLGMGWASLQPRRWACSGGAVEPIRPGDPLAWD